MFLVKTQVNISHEDKLLINHNSSNNQEYR